MATTTTKRKSKTSTPVAPLELDGRIPPQAPDFEEAVLGAILIEKDAYARVSERLRPETFYVKAHELIYSAMVALAMAQRPIDMLTVTEELRRTGTLDEVGGPAYIAGLTTKVMSTSSLEAHAEVLYNKALSRSIIGMASTALKNAYDDIEDVQVQIQEAEGALFNIAQQNSTRDFVPINPLVKGAITEMQIAANREEGISGLTTGFPDIDKLTSGWQNSDLVIIAARPAMGKTAFVVSMAKYMAVDHNIPVALFNLEMSAVQLVKRFLSNVCEIDGQTIKSGRLDESEWARLNHRIGVLESAPLYINDTPSLSVFELRTKARRLVREHQIKLIIIDYLQLMNASGMSFGNREQEVSTISRSLKMLAKELNIPIIALSQLNRGVETRVQGADANSRRPQLSDLRESGAIEQDADIVCFIHRPEYYKLVTDPETGESLRGVGEFIIAKHRNGPVDTVRLAFKADYAKFAPIGELNAMQEGASAPSGGRLGRKRPPGASPTAGTQVTGTPQSPQPQPMGSADPFDPLSGDPSMGSPF